jgi:hypothetical protein
VPDLEVSRLDVQHFKLIIATHDPSPAPFEVSVKLFLNGNFMASADVRVFETYWAHSTGNFLEP